MQMNCKIRTEASKRLFAYAHGDFGEQVLSRTTKPPLSTHKATPVHTTNLAALVALRVGQSRSSLYTLWHPRPQGLQAVRQKGFQSTSLGGNLLDHTRR